jgi:hypothetical protein
MEAKKSLPKASIFSNGLLPFIHYSALCCLYGILKYSDFLRLFITQTKLLNYFNIFGVYMPRNDRLCGLVVRVLGYISGGPGSIHGATTKKKVAALERGPLSLVSTTEELLDRKVAAPA